MNGPYLSLFTRLTFLKFGDSFKVTNGEQQDRYNGTQETKAFRSVT